MPNIRIISDPSDSSSRPTTRTLVDALTKVIDLGEMPPDSMAKLLVSRGTGGWAFFSGLRFRSSKGDQVQFALPISKGCWAISTLGSQQYFTFDRFDGADVDLAGNVELVDGTFVHAVSLDVLPIHFELPELEETIVYLTIRYLKQEQKCIRMELGSAGIDYSMLHHLRVSSVKELTRYVNRMITAIELGSSVTPFNQISVATVQRTLDLVGIQKSRGRPRKAAAI